MKLSINTESVDSLKNFADKLTLVIDDILVATEKLVHIYNAVSDSVGPHSQSFMELILSVKKAQETSSEAIKELPYMLRSTADKMESYINNGTLKGVQVTSKLDIKQRYANAARKRLLNPGTDPVTKDVYQEYENSIRVIDLDFMGTPFYNSMTNGIKLNAMEDLHNPTGSMSYYYHEVGHMIDNLAGNGHTWLSSDVEYGKKLREDVDSYIRKTMITQHCEIEEAYDIISDEISGNWNSNVSDIFGSLTKGRCQGEWGHHPKYWEADSSRIEKEAFANMFETSIGDEKKVEIMRCFFPTAYDRFIQVVRSR